MGGISTAVEHSTGGEGVLRSILEAVAVGFELAGVAILALGGLWVAARALRGLVGGKPAYEGLRRGLGRVLLLGLEVLVAADIVQTVAVETTLESVGTLGLLVVVRTVLSFALSAEVDGIVPWRRAEVKATIASPEGEAGAD